MIRYQRSQLYIPLQPAFPTSWYGLADTFLDNAASCAFLAARAEDEETKVTSTRMEAAMPYHGQSARTRLIWRNIVRSQRGV
jgi:hypothetical protein